MAGVGKRIEEAIEALDKKQLKQALYLTDKKGLERHHEWVKEAAKTCLVSRGDKKTCDAAIKEARERLVSTITPPLEDTSLDGLEEYLREETKMGEALVKEEAKQEKTEAELYEECEECHVANAVVEAGKLCQEVPQEVPVCRRILDRVGQEDVQPGEWLKILHEVKDEATGEVKEKMTAIVTDLVGYLEKRNSPLLKVLEPKKEETGG